MKSSIALVVLMLLPACTIVCTSEPEWRWPQDMNMIE